MTGLMIGIVMLGFQPTLYAQSTINLALNRPVYVSSTDHAPTPAEFAVDGEDDTGWRSSLGQKEQWMLIDLQTNCSIQKIILFSESNSKTKVLDYDSRGETKGDEVFSSYPISYTIQLSMDKRAWQDVRKVHSS